MKKKTYLFLFSALLFASLFHVVSYMWRTEMRPDVFTYNYIWVIILVCLGSLELLSLYKLKQHVHKLKVRRHLHYCRIVDFIFFWNCVGLPIYFITCVIAKYYAKG